MKKILIMLCAPILSMLSIFAAGCGEKNYEGEQVGMSNPIHIVDDSEALKAQLGYAVAAPAEAEEAAYSYIEGEGIGQVSFKKGGISYMYRVKSAEAAEDISGVYASWTETVDAEYEGLALTLKYVENAEGIVYWYDAEAGVTYCVSVDGGASREALIAAAALVTGR